MFVRNHIDLAHLHFSAKELIASFPTSRIFAFYGKMGSGKTTFIQEICKALHSANVVTSPTFAIINEYFTSSGTTIYHFDFYRLKNISEAYDLGYEDYFINEPKHSILDDHVPFIESGIPAVDIIDIEYPYWHTSQDTLDKISPNSLAVVGETLLQWILIQGVDP